MDQARAQRRVSESSRATDFRSQDFRSQDFRAADSFPPSGLPRDPATGRGSSRESGRPPGVEPFDQRLERWVSRGREFVDGVSGARPGARGPVGAGGGVNPNRLGRWVEERLDWLLDDAGEDDWREPWQESETPAPARQLSSRERSPAAVPDPPPTRPIRPRRGLEAISRRSQSPAASAPGPTPAQAPSIPSASNDDDWPDEASFSLNRWQRPLPSRAPDPLQSSAIPPAGPATPPSADEPPAGRGRPLPRSTRRR